MARSDSSKSWYTPGTDPVDTRTGAVAGTDVAGADDEATAADTADAAGALSTSTATILPLGPLPCKWLRATPDSRASFLARGEANTLAPLDATDGGATAATGAAIDALTGAAEGTAAAAGSTTAGVAPTANELHCI